MSNIQGRYKRRNWGTGRDGRPGFITSSGTHVSNIRGGKSAQNWVGRKVRQIKQGGKRRWR